MINSPRNVIKTNNMFTETISTINTTGEALPIESTMELGGIAIRGTQIMDTEDLSEGTTEEYFHGSGFPFKKGDIIRPGSSALVDEHGVQQASATRVERSAWFYAEDRADDYIDGEKMNHDGVMVPVGVRPRVYRVAPTDGKTPRHLGPQYGEVNSPSFTVLDVIDTKPGHQGTIPDINWSKYSPYIGTNHPELQWQEHHDPYYDNPSHKPSPNDVPFPELGEQYVADEKKRAHEEDDGMIF